MANRNLRLSDVAAVEALERLCNPLPWNAEGLLAFVSDDESTPSGAVGKVSVSASGEIVGYVCARLMEDESEILVLGVHPDHRRRGVAQSLLLELRHLLQASACKSLFLEVRANNAAALLLYGKLGFVETGVRKGYYADTGEDARVLRWDLSR